MPNDIRQKMRRIAAGLLCNRVLETNCHIREATLQLSAAMTSSGRYVYLNLSHVGFAAKVIALFFTTMTVVALAAEQRQTISSVEPLYRAHRFGSAPNLNPKTTFRVRELDVPNLWSTLGLQLFEAEEIVGGDAFAWRQFLCREGVVHPFVESFGGHGVMSGVVHANALYYSYSWGSGIHRSFVGRLTIQNGILEIGRAHV